MQDDDQYRFGWRDLALTAYRKWWVKAIILVIIPAVILNFWLLRYDDFGQGCHVKIRPPLLEMNSLDIKRAISLLKDRLPQDYGNFCRNVRIISPDMDCGGIGGGCFHPVTPDQISISTVYRLKESHTEFTASLIVHEVCHLLQWKKVNRLNEAECYAESCRVLKSLGVRSGYYEYCSY